MFSLERCTGFSSGTVSAFVTFMLADSSDPVNLRDESARCKASLEAFTENLIVKLGVSQNEAANLRKYDRSRRDGNMYLHFPYCFLEAFGGIALEQVRTIALSG